MVLGSFRIPQLLIILRQRLVGLMASGVQLQGTVQPVQALFDKAVPQHEGA
jgi:hypothetical protein